MILFREKQIQKLREDKKAVKKITIVVVEFKLFPNDIKANNCYYCMLVLFFFI